MKITIDLDKLLEDQEISQAEYDKFSQFSAHSTSALAFNILIGFGVVAVSGAILALVPNPITAIGLGLLICVVGLLLVCTHATQWSVLANICLVIGALLFGGGVIVGMEGSVGAFLLVAVAYGITGIFARSGLLTALGVLALSSCLGARAAHIDATYFVGVQEPTLTIVLFIIFSIATYRVARHLTAKYQSLAIVASRTGVFLANLGFWVGSIWGDSLKGQHIHFSAEVFAVLWALALTAAGAWAWRRDRRWLVNAVAVFAAIHFYTQWFEILGTSPGSVLIAGILALGFAIGLHRANVKLGQCQ